MQTNIAVSFEADGKTAAPVRVGRADSTTN